jgi:hypothetical protein
MFSNSRHADFGTLLASHCNRHVVITSVIYRNQPIFNPATAVCLSSALRLWFKSCSENSSTLRLCPASFLCALGSFPIQIPEELDSGFTERFA